MRTKYRVKVLTERPRIGPDRDLLRWYWRCGAPDCDMRHGSYCAYDDVAAAHDAATRHAATCDALRAMADRERPRALAGEGTG